MLVKAVKFTTPDKSVEHVSLSNRKGAYTGNYFTIVNGENGSGKSALLRIVADAALGLEASRQSKMFASQIGLSLTGEISRTIALSGTHNDRFPVNSGVELRLNSNRFDLMELHYFGPKQSGTLASAARAANNVSHSILKDDTSPSPLPDPSGYLLEYMGFSRHAKIGFNYQAKKLIKQKANYWSSLREHIQNLTEGLPSSSKISPSMRLSIQSVEAIFEDSALRNLFIKPRLELNVDFTREHIVVDPTSNLSDLIGIQPNLSAGQWLADLVALGVLSTELYLTRKNRPQDSLSLDELSSGQWQLINLLLNLSLNVRDDSLILIDEPENSLHPKWQNEFVMLVRRLISHRTGCHVIVATHSPLIAASLLPHEGELIKLSKDATSQSITTEMEGIAYGRLPSDVLQDVFDMDSSRPPELTKATEMALGLLKTNRQSSGDLRTVARRLNVLRKSLPLHDPLNPVLDAIVSIAFPESAKTVR